VQASRDQPLEETVLRLSAFGPGLAGDEEALAALVASCRGDDGTIDRALLASHAARAAAALAGAPADDERAGRLRGVLRPVLARLGGAADAGGGGEAALRARLEERLAAIVCAMELARLDGDDDLAERLHARYIELGTAYASRLAREEGAAG
jgi:hypothetical protein